MESQMKTNLDASFNSLATDSPPLFSTDSPPPFSALSPPDIHQMLQPFHHDQLLSLLHAAAIRHPDVQLAIRDFADLDTTFRRLYVRSLGGETTSETLHRVFSPFGEIEEAIVIIDKSTGRSKGFGFVTFKHLDGAYLALKNPCKRINGRITVSHLASAGDSNVEDDVSSRKIFVANIPFVIPPGKLLNHFLRYGEVEEGPLAFDKACGRERGFAFFVYKTEEGAKAAIREPFKVIDGYKMHCRLSVEYKKVNTPPEMMAPQYGGYGGGIYQGYTTFYVPPPMVVVPQFGDFSGGGGGYGASSGHGGGGCSSPLPPSSAVGTPATASGSQSQGSTSHHEQQPQPKPARKCLPRGMYLVQVCDSFSDANALNGCAGFVLAVADNEIFGFGFMDCYYERSTYIEVGTSVELFIESFSLNWVFPLSKLQTTKAHLCPPPPAPTERAVHQSARGADLFWHAFDCTGKFNDIGHTQSTLYLGQLPKGARATRLCPPWPTKLAGVNRSDMTVDNGTALPPSLRPHLGSS
ncbi:unnamed protein product [Lupinus luteus]|uniref:RRM domain-containing protein n=1 Tax=Lupinus luteus TaxID=3873 RepID=A0AAV1VVD3_LUPLU